jgi:hypothetical protein
MENPSLVLQKIDMLRRTASTCQEMIIMDCQISDEQQLLRELLNLPLTTSPENWLQTTYPSEMSRFFLHGLLNHLYSQINYFNNVKSRYRGKPENELDYFMLLSVPLPAEKEILRLEYMKFPEERLIDIYTGLQKQLKDSPKGKFSRFYATTFMSILHEMVNDPALKNPVQWLQANYLEKAIVFCLHHLLLNALPAIMLWESGEKNIRSIQLKQKTSTEKSMTITKLIQQAECFKIIIEFKTPAKLLQPEIYHYWWQGRPVITDSKKGGYVVCFEQYAYESRLFNLKHKLELKCIPAIQTDIEWLEVSLTDTRLAARYKEEKAFIPRQMIRWGNVKWKMSL